MCPRILIKQSSLPTGCILTITSVSLIITVERAQMTKGIP